MKGCWVPHDVRDQIMDVVRRWSDQTEIATFVIVAWIGFSLSPFHHWRGDDRKVNEYNAWIPRDHRLKLDERQAILQFYAKHPFEGYRRLTFMMIDADGVACRRCLSAVEMRSSRPVGDDLRVRYLDIRVAQSGRDIARLSIRLEVWSRGIPLV